MIFPEYTPVIHPLVFIGYSASDLNIQSILSDIDEIVPNLFIVEYKENIIEDNTYPTEKLINLYDKKTIWINSVAAKDHDWIYEAFTNESAIERVNTKLL